MKLSDLVPNPENPRVITQERLALLEDSLGTFGDLSGIVHNEVTGLLVGGNQRSKVLPKDSDIRIVQEWSEPTKAGTVAVGYVTLPSGELFSYRRVRWDENTEKLANIAANHHGGEDDKPKLAQWLLDLDQHNMNLELTGIPLAEIEDLLAPIQINEGKCDEDEVPETPEEPKVKRGELWILGNHRLLCGDSTVAPDVEKVMGGSLASVWLSDPPYGINHVEVSQEKGRSQGYEKIANDDLQDAEFEKFIFQCISASLPFMKDGFAFYMWHAMKMQGYTAAAAAAAAAAGILFHRQIIWVKPQFVFGRGHYHWRHELCLMGWLQGNEPPFYGERNQSTIWEVGRENDKIHPTQKPIALLEPSILNHTKPGEVIYEPFAGSGSTLIASEKTGRACRAIELSPAYCSVIIERWQKFTGREAVREDGFRYSDLASATSV